MFPEFRAQLEANAFFSLNAFWTWEKNKHYLSAAQIRHRTNLRYLCVCYTDLDFYHQGRSFGELLGMIVDLQDRGVIPPASVIVRSGRGMWLLWILHDSKNPSCPPRAFPEKQLLYIRIQRAIYERLAQLGADAGATDSMRLARVPGSWHTVAAQRTKYWIQVDKAGKSHSYTMEELSQHFGVEPRRLHKKETEAFIEAEKGKNENRKRGPTALTAYRLRDFLKLWELRRGFHKGCRNHAALLYAWILKCSKVPKDEALNRVSIMGLECRPPLSPSACIAAVKSAYSRQWKSGILKADGTTAPVAAIAWQTIGDWLKVTPQEAEQLEKVPPARQFILQEPTLGAGSSPGATRTLVKQQRQTIIGKLVTELGQIPPERKMTDLLKARGFDVSNITVHKDYRDLGLRSERTQEAREERRATQESLLTQFC
jgi:hypothetical protein